MPQLDKFTYFSQFFWSFLFFFTFYILQKLRNRLLEERGNNIPRKDPKSLEDILIKGFSTGVSYMYSSLFDVFQRCKAVDLLGTGIKIFSWIATMWFVEMLLCPLWRTSISLIYMFFLREAFCSPENIHSSLVGVGGVFLFMPAGSATSSSSGWTDILDTAAEGSSQSSANSQSIPSVNQGEPPYGAGGREAAAPNRPVEQFPPIGGDEVIGGDSVESITRRLLQNNHFPSSDELFVATGNAKDLFDIKADIIRRMAVLHPQGDWLARGARALDNSRTATGEERLERLISLREDLYNGGIRSQAFWNLSRKVFLRREDIDSESQV